MNIAAVIAIATGCLTIILGLVKIVHDKLNTEISKNTDGIAQVRDEYVKKEDFNRQNDKVDAKLDKILDILMGGNREK